MLKDDTMKNELLERKLGEMSKACGTAQNTIKNVISLNLDNLTKLISNEINAAII